MIPTVFRDRLPSNLAYPVGAELLSKALATAPQAAQLSLIFRKSPTIFESEFQAQLKSGAPFPVISAKFTKLERGLSADRQHIDAGMYNEQWELWVYPVPTSSKFAARAAIAEQGIPAILGWLRTPRTATWRSGRHSLEIAFDPATTSVRCAEDA